MTNLRTTINQEALKPCPFCGAKQVTIYEGSTYRWYGLECVECQGRCGEIRRPTPGEGGISADDLEAAWNARAETMLTVNLDVLWLGLVDDIRKDTPWSREETLRRLVLESLRQYRDSHSGMGHSND